MDIEEIEEHKWKMNFWTIFFSILSIILLDLVILVPETEQKIIISSFLSISIIISIILFCFKKMNYNEKSIKILQNNILKISNELTEKFNCIRELYNLRLDIEMLKKEGKELK